MATGKINKRTVDGQQPGERDEYLWDSELRGFGLKTTPLGRKVYMVQFRASGRIRRVTIGVHGSPWTPDLARQEAIKLLSDVAEGNDPAETKTVAKNTLTMAELCDLYMAKGVSTKKASTLAIDRGRIDRHIKPLLGRKRVDQVTKADIQRFMQDVANGKTATDIKTGLRGRAIVTGGRGTSARVIGLLGGIFSFAVERGLCPINPVHGVKKFQPTRRERFLTGDELSRLGDTLRQAEEAGTNPVAIAALRLLLLTGCRRGEALTLQWSHVDFERACLRLPDSKTGTKVVHLGGAALVLLAELPRLEGQPYVFPGAVAGKALVGLPRIWQRIREQAGITDLRIHDLRHGFASVGAAAGMGLPIIGKLLGHTQASTTQRYAHLADDPVKLAADRISGTIAAALAGNKAEVIPLPRSLKTATQGG